MTTAGIFLLAVVSAVLLTLAYRPLIWNARRNYLASYQIPDAVIARFSSRHPELKDKEVKRVQQGMLQYFEICQRAKGRFVSMPSQVVDDLWHEFILFTRNYELFCQKAFGKYLHHTPVEAMAGPTQATSGIRRTWSHACRMENIDPRDPRRLPLLFALDAQLGIANGFFYRLNCRDTAVSSSNAFCASDIGCGGGHGCGGGCGGGGD